MSTPTDAWRAMVLVLAGESPPPLPDLPGRLHRAPPTPETDPYADQWDRLHNPISTNERDT